MDNEYKYMVATLCKTFNQGPYIEEALNGFAIQQTTFPCVYIVIDDASTDGEPQVLRQWAENNLNLDAENGGLYEHKPFGDRYVAYLKNNTNSLFVIILLSENHHGKKPKKPYFAEWIDNAKYRAICEGDDYWIDPLKLEKQVEFLETHQDYSICHTSFTYFIEENKEKQDSSKDTQTNLEVINNNEDVRYAILNNNRYRIQTLTVLLRNSSLLRAYEDLKQYKGKFLMSDTQLWIALLKYGKIHFVPESTGVYRIHGGSSSRQVDPLAKARFNLSSAEMRIAMADYCSFDSEKLSELYSQYYFMLSKYYLYNREYKPFIEERFITIKDRIMLFICRFPLTNYIIRRFYVNE